MLYLTAIALMSLSTSQAPTVRLLTPKPAAFQVAEFRVELPGTYENPFDPEQIAVDAQVSTPSGRHYSIPGFYYRAFERKLVSGKEVDTPTGSGEWRVRICPTEPGRYSLEVVERDRTGSKKTRPTDIRVSAPDALSAQDGFIALSTADRRFFVRGSHPYYPIGANVAWGGDRKSFGYDDWLPKFGAQGANYARVWLGPSWGTFAMESPESGFGRIDLANAYRLDHVLNLAREHGMSLMLCIDSYNTLRDQDAYPQWDTSPYNKVNGGPLAKPADFWTNSEVRRRYHDKLRYLVARYGAFTNVFAWEFWNEIDLTRGFDPQAARSWHEEMAKAIRALDPYRHLVTTSFSSSPGFKAVDSLPELDLVQTHLYSSNLVREAAVLHAEKTGKAHLIGEVGADGGGPRQEDRDGLQIHDALWVSLGCGMSGTAMTWWWDNLIAPNDLYHLYRPVADFVKGIDWPNERFKPAEVAFAFADPVASSARGDLEFVDGPARFGAASYNRPATVHLHDEKATGDLPIASILHGTHNHPELHNPVTFVVNLSKSTTLDILVGDVSGYGGAKLRATLDGQVVIDKDFADTDAGNDALKQYAGAYPVPIPAGAHRVTIENLGADWIDIGYQFVGLASTRKPPLDIYAIQGENTAVAWLQVAGRSWQNVIQLHRVPQAAPPTTIRFAGLAKGAWDVELWDTWQGTIVSRSKAISDGKTTSPILLPKIETDLAIRMRRRSEPNAKRLTPSRPK